MGAGLILIPLAILIYLPFLAWSFVFYYKSNKIYKKEREIFTIRTSFRLSITFIYIVAFLTNENFGEVISDTIIYTIKQEYHWLEYWLKQNITSMIFGWDDFEDIIYYWSSIIIAFIVVCPFAYIMDKSKNISLYAYNRNKLALFLLLVQPFIVVSMLGRLFGWRLVINEWLNL